MRFPTWIAHTALHHLCHFGNTYVAILNLLFPFSWFLHYFGYLQKNNTQQVHQRSSPDSLQIIQLALRRGWLLL